MIPESVILYDMVLLINLEQFGGELISCIFSRTTRTTVPFAAETQYVVPTSGKDALPLASEGPRYLAPNSFNSSTKYLSKPRHGFSWLFHVKDLPNQANHRSLRSMSDVQESAQILAGQQLPTAVLSSILHGADLAAKLVGVVNLTPYDAHLESTCVHWQQNHGSDHPLLKSFSVSDGADEVLFSERVLANQLLQDWSIKKQMLMVIPNQKTDAGLFFKTI